jgi:hypothetical protein
MDRNRGNQDNGEGKQRKQGKQGIPTEEAKLSPSQAESTSKYRPWTFLAALAAPQAASAKSSASLGRTSQSYAKGYNISCE